MIDEYAEVGLLCRRVSFGESMIRVELARWLCEIFRAVGSDCDRDDDDEADDEEGRVPREIHDVVVALSAVGKSDSFWINVSGANCFPSTSIGGDMSPGEVQLLSSSSDSMSFLDHKELESSHIEELPSSVSVMSDATLKVGLPMSSISSSSLSASSNSSSTLLLMVVLSILAGAGSSSRTLASSTPSSVGQDKE